MTGEKLSSFRLLFLLSFIGQFVYPVEGERGWGDRFLVRSLLENMKVWCKIQVIINPLLETGFNDELYDRY